MTNKQYYSWSFENFTIVKNVGRLIGWTANIFENINLIPKLQIQKLSRFNKINHKNWNFWKIWAVCRSARRNRARSSYVCGSSLLARCSRSGKVWQVQSCLSGLVGYFCEYEVKWINKYCGFYKKIYNCIRFNVGLAFGKLDQLNLLKS